MILTALDGQHVAEDECPLGGHTPERAKHMILRAAAESNPLLFSGDPKLLLEPREEELP